MAWRTEFLLSELAQWVASAATGCIPYDHIQYRPLAVIAGTRISCGYRDEQRLSRATVAGLRRSSQSQ
jgi:hypothetical protein